MRTLLLLGCTLSLLTTATASFSVEVEYNSTALHFVPGTVVSYLEDPLFYDAYLPLLFQFQIPKHMDNALKIMWSHATVCNVSDSRYEGKLCPVVHHLHKIVANLSSDMGFWKDFLPPLEDLNPGPASGTDTILTPATSSSTTSAPETGKSGGVGVPPPPLTPDCGVIRPHFRQLYTPPEQLTSYLTSLASCGVGSSHSSQLPPPTPWIIDKQIYYTMVDRFYTEFYRSLPGTGNIDWVVTLNSYVNAQNLLLVNNYIESSRVLSALMECNTHGRIPISFIKPEMLRSSLETHRGSVTSSHYTYLWEVEVTKDLTGQIQSYYNLPIADCTLTKDYKLVVRLLIPLRRPEVESKLLQIKTYPFLEKLPAQKTSKSEKLPPKDGGESSKLSPEAATHSLQLCKLGAPGTLRMIQSNFGALFEYDPDNCKSGQLCARSSLNSFLPLDACSAALLSPGGGAGDQKSESLIREGCPLTCFPIDSKSLPIFQRISSNTILALGTEDHQIFLQCGGQPLEKLGLVEIGALEIRMSCGCQISYRNLVLRPSGPCGSRGGDLKGQVDEVGVRVRRLLPLHWKGFLSGNGSFENGGLSNKLAEGKDKYYYHYYPVQEHEAGKDSKDSGVGVAVEGGAAEQVSREHSSTEGSAGGSGGASGGVVGQLVTLWILVLTLVGTNILLGYKLHGLQQWRKIQVYKDTRIVYSVPPSPQFPNKF